MPCPDCAAHKERADQSDASANEAEAKLATLAAMAARWIIEAERVEMEAETVALGAPFLGRAWPQPRQRPNAGTM